MRVLAAVLLLGFVAPALPAADKDEDKAKEAALAFLKAVKAKDLDAVMKTVEVPFLTIPDGKPVVAEKAEAVKADLKAKLETIKDANTVPAEVATVLAFADVRDKVADEGHRKAIEKVLGDGGFVALAKTPDGKTIAILVRLKDGKARVVGFGPG